MLRLLVVDDEDQIVDWMYELFKTSMSYEMDVFKAYSGSEALEWLNRTPIDIVLTDICMPGMDGLQLLKKVKERWPWCRVIFLTGHDDFDYIYEAVQYQGVSYLLKSENDRVIVAAVEKAAKDAEEEIKNLRTLEHARMQLKTVLPTMQKEFFSDLVDGITDISTLEQTVLNELDLSIAIDKHIIMLVGRLDRNSGEGLKSLARVHYSLKIAVEKRLPEDSGKAWFVHERAFMVWILQPGENFESPSLFISLLKAAVEHAQAYGKEVFNTTVSFAVTEDFISWNKIAEKYEVLKKLLSMGIGSGQGMILTEGLAMTVSAKDTIQSIKNSHDLPAAIKKIPLLERYLEAGNKTEFDNLLEDVTKNLAAVKERSHFIAVEMYYSISTMLISYINRMDMVSELSFKIGLYKLFRQDEFNSWEEAVMFLKEIVQLLFDTQKSAQGTRADDTVSRLKEYISENIHTDLSLYSLGEFAHFSPVYLSRLFKQVSGENLTEYITEQRIKKAKIYLESSEMKIHEIAQSVGCSSSNYFVRMFKKETGLTPQEYRIRYQEMNK